MGLITNIQAPRVRPQPGVSFGFPTMSPLYLHGYSCLVNNIVDYPLSRVQDIFTGTLMVKQHYFPEVVKDIHRRDVNLLVGVLLSPGNAEINVAIGWARNERHFWLEIDGLEIDLGRVYASTKPESFGVECFNGDYFKEKTMTLAKFLDTYYTGMSFRHLFDDMGITIRDAYLPSRENNFYEKAFEYVTPFPWKRYIFLATVLVLSLYFYTRF